MSGRRRFVLAAAVGAVPGLLVAGWLLTQGRLELLGWRPSGNFYDAQAHSLLDGHLSVDPAVVRHDGFLGRNGTYLYQGPVPALLRIPAIVLFGDRYDGRLGQLSLLVAFTVTVAIAMRLLWRVRALLRGPVPVGTVEAVLVGVFAFALPAGSALTFLASRAWVFHEAVAWGVVFGLAALDQLVSLVRRPTGWALVRASGFAAAAMLTRASIGLGPVAGLALVAVGVIGARVGGRPASALAWSGPGARGRRLPITLYAVAAAVPVVGFAVVNWAKFGTLFSVPFGDQVFTKVDPQHGAFLDANGGTYFGLQFVPKTLLDYLRPDGIDLSTTFPFVGFRAPSGTLVGGTVFDLVDRAASVPASMPFLLVLAVVGVVLAFRPRAWRDVRFGPLRTPMVAALVAGLTVFPFGFVAQRYLGDMVPFLVVAGVVGLQALLATHGRRRPPRSRAVAATGLVVLAAFGAWVNVALALDYQRLWAPVAPPTLVAGYLGFQEDVAEALGTGGLTVRQGDALPDGTGRAGELFVVGDCDGLYLSDGLETNRVKRSPWIGVELGPDRRVEADVRFDRPSTPGTEVPIASIGDDEVVARWVDDDHVAFGYRPAGGDLFEDVPVRIDPGRRYALDLRVDDRVEELSMRLDDARVLSTFRTDPVDGIDLAAAFPGELRRRSVSTPLCEELLGSLRAR